MQGCTNAPRFRASSRDEPTDTLFVGNAGDAVGLGEAYFKDACARFGEVRVEVPDPRKNILFLSFSTPEDAGDAKDALEAAEHAGRRLRVNYAAVTGPGAEVGASTAEEAVHVCLNAQGTGIEGLELYPDFVSEAEESELLRQVREREWTLVARRHVLHFGHPFDYMRRTVDCSASDGSLPGFCSRVVDRIHSIDGVTQLDQLTVNRYPAGVGLAPHVDSHAAFSGAIISLSLGTAVVMEFRRGASRRALLLERRSLLVMKDECRYAWQHYIPHRKTDNVNGRVLRRGPFRTSFTFRSVRRSPCACDFPEQCDDQSTPVPPTRKMQIYLQQQEQPGADEAACRQPQPGSLPVQAHAEGPPGGWRYEAPAERAAGILALGSGPCSTGACTPSVVEPAGCPDRRACASQPCASTPVHVEAQPQQHGPAGPPKACALRSPRSDHAACGQGFPAPERLCEGTEQQSGHTRPAEMSECSASAVYGYAARSSSAPSCGAAAPNTDSCSHEAGRSALGEQQLEQLEAQHVHKVYDAIAPHFSSTRFAVWPAVRGFLEPFDPGAVLMDVGCGNGKYFHVRQDLVVLGCDPCRGLALAAARTLSMPPGGAAHPCGGADVVLANGFAAPFRHAAADGVLCVAVLHHVAGPARRLRFLACLRDLLRPGGRALVTVWATEQEDPQRTLHRWTALHQADRAPAVAASVSTNVHTDDYFVPWHLPFHRAAPWMKQRAEAVRCTCSEDGNSPPDSPQGGDGQEAAMEATCHIDRQKNTVVFKRYYHVFARGELSQLVAQLPGTREISCVYDSSNWVITFERLN